MSRVEKYTAMVIQPEVTMARTPADIEVNLERVCQLIDFGVGYFWEVPVRLAVLPEYFLQGVTTPGKGEDGLAAFMDKAITNSGTGNRRPRRGKPRNTTCTSPVAG